MSSVFWRMGFLLCFSLATVFLFLEEPINKDAKPAELAAEKLWSKVTLPQPNPSPKPATLNSVTSEISGLLSNEELKSASLTLHDLSGSCHKLVERVLNLDFDGHPYGETTDNAQLVGIEVDARVFDEVVNLSEGGCEERYDKLMWVAYHAEKIGRYCDDLRNPYQGEDLVERAENRCLTAILETRIATVEFLTRNQSVEEIDDPALLVNLLMGGLNHKSGKSFQRVSGILTKLEEMYPRDPWLMEVRLGLLHIDHALSPSPAQFAVLVEMTEALAERAPNSVVLEEARLINVFYESGAGQEWQEAVAENLIRNPGSISAHYYQAWADFRAGRKAESVQRLQWMKNEMPSTRAFSSLIGIESEHPSHYSIDVLYDEKAYGMIFDPAFRTNLIFQYGPTGGERVKMSRYLEPEFYRRHRHLERLRQDVNEAKALLLPPALDPSGP